MYLAHQVPSTVSIDAVDISLTQCPPQEWLPTNVNLIAHDIFSTLPADLVGKYDVVHVRLFVCIVKNDDPVFMLTNLIKLLSKWVVLFDLT